MSGDGGVRGLEGVRPEVRRRYYERAYGDVARDAFEGATLDEYLALARVRMPLASDRNLLARAPVEEWRHLLAATADDARGRPEPPPPWFLRARLDRYDLDEAVAAGHDRVCLDGVRDVVRVVPSAGTLSALSLHRCAGAPPVVAPPVGIDRLEVADCAPELEAAALRSYAARSLEVVSPGAGPWDASVVAAHRASDLVVRVTRIAHVEVLAGMPVRSGYVTRLTSDGDVEALVEGWSPTLEELTVGAAVPLDPAVLERCGRLRRVRVESRADHREAWIDWAVDHPGTAVDTERGDAISLLPDAVAEVHRGVAVTREGPATRPRYLVADDLVELLDLPFADNGALEDRLRQVARAARRTVTWGSEAGTFVARVRDLETARWVVDEALASRG